MNSNTRPTKDYDAYHSLPFGGTLVMKPFPPDVQEKQWAWIMSDKTPRARAAIAAFEHAMMADPQMAALFADKEDAARARKDAWWATQCNGWGDMEALRAKARAANLRAEKAAESWDAARAAAWEGSTDPEVVWLREHQAALKAAFEFALDEARKTGAY